MLLNHTHAMSILRAILDMPRRYLALAGHLAVHYVYVCRINIYIIYVLMFMYSADIPNSA